MPQGYRFTVQPPLHLTAGRGGGVGGRTPQAACDIACVQAGHHHNAHAESNRPKACHLALSSPSCFRRPDTGFCSHFSPPPPPPAPHFGRPNLESFFGGWVVAVGGSYLPRGRGALTPFWGGGPAEA